MPPIVLFDHPASTNALKVRILLAELGLDAERVEIPLTGARPPGYRDVHPFALVPALRVDDDLVITESNTALRFLAEDAGRADLRGGDARERARVDGILDSLSLEVRPRLWAVEEVQVYGHEVPPAERQARIDALTETLTAFDSLLHPAGPHAVGEAFTIADAAIAGRLLHLPGLGLDSATAPRVRRALAAARDRPSYAAARTEPSDSPKST